ncbi:MAG: 4Fe-4S binding protein [Chloroflexi bacterium]|nr:4Fe-4S binding protein [Chloroflexota bacterium]
MPIVIDNDKCEGTGDCVDACPTEVIAKQGDKCVVVAIDECIDCEACIAACPQEAIEMA